MYETRYDEKVRDVRYLDLKTRKSKIESLTAAWMTEAASLHAVSPLQVEKDDVVAMRSEFIANLQTALGV